MSLAIFTIVAKNYAAFAKTLCQSIKDNHPEAKFYVALSDVSADDIDLGQNVESIIQVGDIGLPSPGRFAFRYDVLEFSTAIKPYVFRYVFNTTDADIVIYLDPDVLVLSPLTSAIDLLKNGASAVLTPHLTDRIDDGHRPDESVMLRVGVYNLGFIGIGRCHTGMSLISWWCDRLEHGAVVDLENGLFTDQKWADLMPCLFNGVAILRSQAYNVAYWNLAHRKISELNSTWLVNDEPICFFHFSGIDPSNPSIFSRHQDRYSTSNIGRLKDLFNDYVNKINSNNYKDVSKIPYGFGKLADGTSIHPAMRAYFRKFIDNSKAAFQDPFTRLTKEYFNAVDDKLSNNKIITRFMHGLHLGNKELQVSFNLQNTEARLGFAVWFANYASKVYNVEPLFAETSQELISKHQKHRRPTLISSIFKSIVSRIAYCAYDANPRLAVKISRITPAWILKIIHDGAMRPVSTSREIRQLTEKFVGFLSARLQAFVSLLKNPSAPHPSVSGVTLIGYVRGDFGVAQVIRAAAGALQTSDHTFDIYETSTHGVYSENNASFASKITNHIKQNTLVFCVNADQMNITTQNIGKRNIEGRYCVGLWFWELANFPKDWQSAFETVDEIWAPSRFVLDSISSASPKPVIHMPVAVDFSINGYYDRRYFELPEQAFLFVFSYDFHSYSQRKNPAATLLAFRNAFSPDNLDVGLVIKTINGEQHGDAYTELLALANNDPRIKIVNRTLSRDEMYGLIDVCDSYISLHRAEGFGLGLAEAMRLGKPVIGTAYSGNLDFMNEQNSCLVGYKLVPVPEAAYPHWEGQVWAEPDIECATEYLRQIFLDVGFRTMIGQQARDFIIREHSFESVGRKMTERLKQIEDLSLGALS